MSDKLFAQLGRIKDKADLHRWVDSLPDDVALKGIILVDETRESDERAHYVYREVGPISVAETLYMLESYKHAVIWGDQ